MSNSTPTPVFSFQSREVRTIIEDDQPWFAAVDVCRALDISWSGRKILKAFPDDWQRVVKLTTHRRGDQQTVIISEPAVYKLAFRSNKPQADAFTNWVASEVLPAIRKTGKYEAKPAPKPKALPRSSQKALPQVQPDIDALLGKVRFYIAEIAEAEKRITDITDDATLQTFMPHPGRKHPAWLYTINAGCSMQALFSSINFALKAVEESIKLRLQIGA